MPKEVDRQMAEAGGRFETEVRQAMREAGIDTLADLERKTGIKRRTWEDWFGGLHRPRPNSLALAATPLKRTTQQLLARWEGQPAGRRRTLPANPWDAAGLAIVEAIDRQTAMLERVLLGSGPAMVESDLSPSEANAVAVEEAARHGQESQRPRSGRQNGAEQ